MVKKNEDLREYYNLGSGADANRLVDGFHGSKAMAYQAIDGEIHPMDFVMLDTNNPAFVGNHPMIQQAFEYGVAGRVTACELQDLADMPLAKDILQKHTSQPLETCKLIHVVFFPDQKKPFIFWQPFVKKVLVEKAPTYEVK